MTRPHWKVEVWGILSAGNITTAFAVTIGQTCLSLSVVWQGRVNPMLGHIFCEKVAQHLQKRWMPTICYGDAYMGNGRWKVRRTSLRKKFPACKRCLRGVGKTRNRLREPPIPRQKKKDHQYKYFDGCRHRRCNQLWEHIDSFFLCQ